jgi:hypothetical protein
MSLSYNFDFPVVITASGLQPQAPASLLAQLTAAAAAQAPGYTVLPGGLIDDVSGTMVAGMSINDQAKVEAVNSLTPYAANIPLLLQLGQCFGLSLGSVTATSVPVVFSSTSVGYVIPNGFLVGDGTNVYQVQGGGVIQSDETSSTLIALSVNPGSFAVPANTVTELLTSVPSNVSLSVNNPNAGTPASAGETYYSYRARVLQAMLAASVGTSRYIKTIIGQLLGAQSNLISVQAASGGLRIVVGGAADPYAIGYAIWSSVADVSTLQESAVNTDRDNTVALYDYPDTYNVLYVVAPVQTVTMTVTWNTVQTNFTGGAAFPGLVQAPLAAYINGLAVGQVINVQVMNEIFQNAVEDVLDASLLTRLVFTVSINSEVTPPGSGTFAITGDPESSFSCLASGITVTQG